MSSAVAVSALRAGAIAKSQHGRHRTAAAIILRMVMGIILRPPFGKHPRKKHSIAGGTHNR